MSEIFTSLKAISSHIFIEEEYKWAGSMLLSYREAVSDDVSTIVELVNLAYRAECGVGGWTHERELLRGNRIHPEHVTSLMANPDNVMVLAELDGKVASCMLLSRERQVMQLGTFAVLPNLQGQGIGKQMLAYAERYARQSNGVDQLEMVVVSQREELIAYYERRGYQRTGKVMEFPFHLNVGEAKVEGLTVSYLTKAL